MMAVFTLSKLFNEIEEMIAEEEVNCNNYKEHYYEHLNRQKNVIQKDDLYANKLIIVISSSEERIRLLKQLKLRLHCRLN